MLFYTNVFTRGDEICFRGFKDGKRVKQKIPFKPTLYVRSGKQSEYKSLWGDNLDKVQLDSIKEARSFVDQYKEVSNFPIFGNTNYSYQFISRVFPNDIEFDMSLMKIVTIDIETSTEMGFPDPKYGNEEILLISSQDFNTKQITTFGCWPYLTTQPNSTYVQCKDEFDLLRKFIEFLKHDCPDVITGWNVNLFDIPYLSTRIEKVLGEKALKECSPYNVVTRRDIEFSGGRTQLAFDWAGISILDYLDLYKKFSYTPQESYKLDHIASQELGKEKLKNPYSTFKEFYSNDSNLFIAYNIRDVELVDQLEDKMRLINLIITMAYDAKCNYVDVFSPVRTWDCILHNALLKKKILVHNPPPVDPESDRSIIGAFVKDPTPGKYDWVVSFDAASLYPSIMMTFNMSPETLIDGQKFLADEEKSIQKLLNEEVDTGAIHDEDVTMVANGQCFRKDRKGIIPELIEHYFAARQIAKKQMLEAEKKLQLIQEEIARRGTNNSGGSAHEKLTDKELRALEWQTQSTISALNSKQMAAKILMNSLYGGLGNIFFRYNDKRISEGITMTGQLIIRTVGAKLNEYLNKVCETSGVEYAFYSDTDSVYFTFGPLVEKFFSDKPKSEIVTLLDRFCVEKINPMIDKACNDLLNYLNAYQRRISFKREVIGDRGIWIAKKRYAIDVHNAEGVAYDPPKLKVMGMEIVRSSTPAPARKALKDSVAMALTKTEEDVKQYVSQLEASWVKQAPEDISFPRSVNGLNDYKDSNSIFKKATPIHVKGALIYNHLIDSLRLTKKYQLINEGDKIKFVYLKEPNPIGSHVISFLGELPEEFKLHKYIDYDRMFEKSFIDPLDSLLSCVGWQLREKATLEGLFS